MVTKQRRLTISCDARKKCKVCEAREAASLGLKSQTDPTNFYRHAAEANGVKAAALVKANDGDRAEFYASRAGTFARLAGGNSLPEDSVEVHA